MLCYENEELKFSSLDIGYKQKIKKLIDEEINR